MDMIPNHRALLAVDVVGASGLDGYHRGAVPDAVSMLLKRAFAKVDLDPVADVLNWEHTGDGAWLTLPSTCLGAVLDAAHALDELARDRNRWCKPEVRLRIAVEVGPVGDTQGLYQPKIVLGRLLDASAFKALFERCVAGDESVTTGLVVSGRVKHDVFGGDYTGAVLVGDFAELAVKNKEFTDTAWIRIPGLDAGSLGQLAGTKLPEPDPDSATRVHNQVAAEHVGGNVSTVQSRDVHGGVTFGSR